MVPARGTSRLGEDTICPHCGAKAGVAEDEAGCVCLVCGGPLVLVEGDVPRPRGERSRLERVKTLRARRAAWAVGGTIVGGFGVAAAVLALAIAAFVDLGATATLALGVVVVIPLVLAAFAWWKASADARSAAEALAEAQRIVAAELLSIKPNTTAADLAQSLRVSEDAAVELMAHAQVSGLLSQPPGSEIKYRVDGGVEREGRGDDAISSEETRARRP